jgi:chemotaxis signal transduction protein
MVSHVPCLDACSFRVATHCFAVDSGCVAEVLHSAKLTPVPLAPEAIAGLLHLRGTIVPVIDLGHRLGLPSTEAGSGRTNLVLRLGDDCYSLLVDDVLDVTQATEVLGKTAGKDAAADKPTYVALMGLDGAQRLADQLATQATQALQDTGLPQDRLAALRALCDMVVQRTH